MDWPYLKEQLLYGKQRLQALETLQEYIQQTALERDGIAEISDACIHVLSDNNFKVCQQGVQVLHLLIVKEREGVRFCAHNMIPALVERLGDTKQPVRQQACSALLAIFEVLKPDFILDRVAKYWSHKNWRIRHGLLQVFAEGLCRQRQSLLVTREPENTLIPNVLKLVEDPDSTVRDAALECLEEVYKLVGEGLFEILNQQLLRPAQLKEIYARISKQHPVSLGNEEAASLSGPVNCEEGPKLLKSIDEVHVQQQRGNSASGRRGGYKDGGGITAGGEQLEVPVVSVTSDKELQIELDTIADNLDPKQGWQSRVNNLVRLEGLVKAGYAATETFYESLKSMKQVLTDQVNDRRSAVSKQACQVIGAISAHLGPKFEVFALHFVPHLFKVLIITIQVMAEAADNSIHRVVHFCPSQRLLALICEAVMKEKSAKLRQHCTIYMLQILEEWNSQLNARSLELIEAALTSALHDAVAETRVVGRSAFAAYHHFFPDNAQAFLLRMDPSTQSKLESAVHQYAEGAYLTAVKTAAFNTGVKAGKANRPAALSLSRPSSAASSNAEGERPWEAGRAALATRRPASEGGFDKVTVMVAARERPQLKKAGTWQATRVPGNMPMEKTEPQEDMTVPISMLMSELDMGARVPLATFTQPKRQPVTAAKRVPWDDEDGLQAKAASIGHHDNITSLAADTYLAADAYRAPHMDDVAGDDTPMKHQASAFMPVGAVAVLRVSPSTSKVGFGSYGGSNNGGGGWQNDVLDQKRALADTRSMVSKAVAVLLAGPKGWNDKVDAFKSLQQGLRQLQDSDASPELPKDLERLNNRFVESMDDMHFKVVVAALCAYREVVCCSARLFEGQLDRTLPILFQKLGDQKEPVRTAAQECLQECACRFPADALLPALSKTLDNTKNPKVKAASMDFSCQHLGEGYPAGAPITPLHIRTWLTRVVPCLNEKIPDVRKAAAAALEVVYTRFDPAIVHSYMLHTTGVELMAMKRALAPLLPEADRLPGPPSTQSLGGRSSASGAASQGSTSLYRPKSTSDLMLPAEARSVGKPPVAPRDRANGGGGGGGAYEHSPCRSETLATSPHTQKRHGSYPGHQPSSHSATSPSSRYAGASQPSPERSALPPRPSTASGPLSSSQLPIQHAPVSTSVATTFPTTTTTTAPPPALPPTSEPLLRHQHPASTLTAPSQATPSVSLGVNNPLAGAPSTLSIMPGASSIASTSASPPPAVLHAPGSLPTDPGLQSRHIAGLLLQLQASPSEDLLAQLASLAPALSEAAWSQTFSQVLLLLMNLFKHSSDGIRETSLMAVRELARCQPRLFDSVLELMLPTLLNGCADESREVRMAATQALEAMVAAMPSQRCIDILKQRLPYPGTTQVAGIPDDSNGDVIYATINCLQKVVQRMSKLELMTRVPGDLLPGLFHAFNHTRADVRKAVVYCLVELWILLGEWLTPYLSAMSTNQLKLITIYYNRAQEQRMAKLAPSSALLASSTPQWS